MYFATFISKAHAQIFSGSHVSSNKVPNAYQKGFWSGILSDLTSHSAYFLGAHEDACVNAVIGMKDEGWHGKGEVWRTGKIQKVGIEAQN